MSARGSHPLRILLVEDHPDTSRVLREALERKGHQVTATGTVAETLAVFPTLQPEVLISDIGLPDGDGWEMLGQMHATHPLLAIAMSGFGSQDDRRRSQSAGYHAHLVKPFKSAELHRLIEESRPVRV